MGGHLGIYWSNSGGARAINLVALLRRNIRVLIHSYPTPTRVRWVVGGGTDLHCAVWAECLNRRSAVAAANPRKNMRVLGCQPPYSEWSRPDEEGPEITSVLSRLPPRLLADRYAPEIVANKIILSLGVWSCVESQRPNITGTDGTSLITGVIVVTDWVIQKTTMSVTLGYLLSLWKDKRAVKPSRRTPNSQLSHPLLSDWVFHSYTSMKVIWDFSISFGGELPKLSHL